MKRIGTILFLIICVVGSILCIKDYKSKDYVPPVITLNNPDLTYEDLLDKDKRLQNVTAIDAVDGDVSDTLIVEGIYSNALGNSYRVIYVAEDSSGNVAKAECIVKRDTNKTSKKVTDKE